MSDAECRDKPLLQFHFIEDVSIIRAYFSWLMQTTKAQCNFCYLLAVLKQNIRHYSKGVSSSNEVRGIVLICRVRE